jgi:hypothetical protein
MFKCRAHFLLNKSANIPAAKLKFSLYLSCGRTESAPFSRFRSLIFPKFSTAAFRAPCSIFRTYPYQALLLPELVEPRFSGQREGWRMIYKAAENKVGDKMAGLLWGVARERA